MDLSSASLLATSWRDRLSTGCNRIEIKGSISRGKSEVNDIDIVCVPVITRERDIFNDPTGLSVNHLEDIIQMNLENGIFSYARDDRGRLCNGPRQKKFMLPEGIKLELWIVQPPAQWGVIATLRTGPREFGHWLVTHKQQGGALPSNMRVKNGALQNGFKIIETPEEIDFFNAIGLPWIEPKDRTPNWSK